MRNASMKLCFVLLCGFGLAFDVEMHEAGIQDIYLSSRDRDGGGFL